MVKWQNIALFYSFIMKKILITSSGFLRKPIREEIIKALPERRPLRVAYIPIAAKYVKDDSYAQQDVAIMLEEGFIIDEIDLSSLHGEELEARLRQSDFLYVQGGNPYLLLKFARESGFMEIVPRLIEEGMPYVGKSAGAYILAPDVVIPEWLESDEEAKHWDRNGVDDTQGMGVVPFIWAAHYTDDYREHLENGMRTAHYPVRAITNDQAFFITEDGTELVGIGNEVIISPHSITPEHTHVGEHKG